MLEQLIKKNEYIQLKILAALTSKISRKKQEIDHILKINSTSSYQHINTLNNDLEELFGKGSVSIVLEGTNLYINYQEQIHVHLIYKRLIQKHLSGSSAFNFLKLLALNNSPHPLFKILDTLAISESYLNKFIKSFNIQFKDTQIVIYKKNKHIHLDGPPQNLFLLKYYLNYFISSLEEDTPLDNFTHTSHLLPFSIYGNCYWDDYRSNILANVLINSIGTLSQIKIFDKTIFSFFSILIEEKNLLTNCGQSKNLSQESKLYINFILHLIRPNALTSKEKEVIIQRIHQQKFPLFSEISDYLKTVIQSLGISEDTFQSLDLNFQLYHYYLTIINIHFHKVNTKKYLQLEQNLFLPADLANSYQSIATHFTNQAISHLSDDAQLVLYENRNNLIIDLYTLSTKSNNQITININIDYIFQPSLIPRLKDTLYNIFNSDTIQFVSNIEKTDLVISDYLIEAPVHIPVFIVLDIHSKKMYHNLTSLILTLIQNKNT